MLIRFAFSALTVYLIPAICLAETAPKYAPLPHKVSSFGACVSGEHLYVYGGHTGKVHSYSTETTTGKFFRVPLAGGKWEELPSGPGLQGLALVAHKGKLYRVGGMQPRNKPGEKHDTVSLTSFAAYDPSARKWQDLPALPEGRSSHDAVVVGDQLYVFGGWKMNGEGKEPNWHKAGLVVNLAKSPLKWEPVEQSIPRRALAVEALGSKVVVLGGLTSKMGSLTRVDFYDSSTGKWTEGPALAKKDAKMGTGFSPAACVQGGRLYVATNDGLINRLSKDGKAWEPAGKQRLTRTVPRLLAGKGGDLILVGGTARTGDPCEVEVITPAQLTRAGTE